MAQGNYLNNPNLKSAGVPMAWTKQQVAEYTKCRDNPEYFIEQYVQVVHVDKGLIPLHLFPFQREIIQAIHNNRKVIVKAARQSGKTTTFAGYLCHYIIFNDAKICAILANKEETAIEILGRVKLAYELLPKWMQQGIVPGGWNKGDIALENGSKIYARATSSAAIRGYSINMLILDEFAFVPPNVAEEFFTAVYPTISSGVTTKIIIVSTPNGMNHFYKIWAEAEKKLNGFKTINVHWSDVPGRDQAWADDQKATLGPHKFRQEMEVVFIGSSMTLIDGAKLSAIPFIPASYEEAHFKIYEKPKKGDPQKGIPPNTYILVADVARGHYGDYSAFSIIDISELPYKVVARYRDNSISPMFFPNIILKRATEYNMAHVLIEINDAGGEVANILMYEMEYDAVIMSDKKGKVSNWGGGANPGLWTSKKTKRLGCEYLKAMIEHDQLVINDYDILFELSNFVSNKRGSYSADEGQHDDLVMGLVNFSYLTSQPTFKELADVSMRDRIFNEKMRAIEDELTPFGFIEDGHEQEGQLLNF